MSIFLCDFFVVSSGSLNRRLEELYCRSTTLFSHISTLVPGIKNLYWPSTYITLIFVQYIQFKLVFTFTDYISAINCNCKIKDIFEAPSPNVLFLIKL